MNRTFRTQTSYDFGHDLTEIVDHLIRTRGFHWPISLAVIDQQGQMLLLTIKTDWAGMTCTIPCDGRPSNVALPACPSVARRWGRQGHQIDDDGHRPVVIRVTAPSVGRCVERIYVRV
jgi:hypothetical protein